MSRERRGSAAYISSASVDKSEFFIYNIGVKQNGVWRSW